MLSLIQYSTIAGNIREKNKNGYYKGGGPLIHYDYLHTKEIFRVLMWLEALDFL